MARRDREASPDEVEVETTDTSAEASAEAPAEGSEPEAAAEVVIDLSGFEAAATAAVEGKDEGTGEPTQEGITNLNEAYRTLDGQKAKNKAKAYLNDQMKDAMNRMDIVSARAYMVLSESLTAAGPKTERAPADPSEAYVLRVASLTLGLELAQNDRPEGLAADAEAKIASLLEEARGQVPTYQAYLDDEAEDKSEPEGISTVTRSAFKVASGKAAGSRKAGSTFTGERRDIGEHISQAFADVPEGTFLTVAEIRNHKSTEYGDNPPSAGAISARLFPSSGKCTVAGVTPGQNDKGNRGATKVAA